MKPPEPVEITSHYSIMYNKYANNQVENMFNLLRSRKKKEDTNRKYLLACGQIRKNNCGHDKQWHSYAEFDRQMVEMGFEAFYKHCLDLGLSPRAGKAQAIP